MTSAPACWTQAGIRLGTSPDSSTLLFRANPLSASPFYGGKAHFVRCPVGVWLADPWHHQGRGSFSHTAQAWQHLAAASHLPATSLSPLSASGPPPCVEQLTLNALCMSPVRMPFRQTLAHARDGSPNCQLTSYRSLIFICSDSYLPIIMHSGPRAPVHVPPLHPKPGRTLGGRRGIQF